MKSSRKTLDFVVVGAPKCGTTSLFHTLNERAEISLLGKDSHLLGKDLELPLRDHTINLNDVIDRHPENSIVGDVSVWYLYSETAAREIHELNPNAKIIICLRNPLELIPSLHNQHVKGGDESEPDLNTALTKDFNLESIAAGVHFKQRPRYADVVNFGQQIARYTERFDNVLFVFHEDLKLNYAKSIQRIEDFLGLEIRKDITEMERNKRQQVVNPALVNVLKKKPAFIKSVFRIVVPSKKIRHNIMESAMKRAISDDESPSPVEFTMENRNFICCLIEKQLPLLRELTGRDCSIWLKDNDE